MKLSEFRISKIKPKEKAFRLSDGAGLHLLVHTNGSKLWQFRYRFMGKENVLSFGKYPLVTLAEARTKRDLAKKQIIDGINPSAQKKIDKIHAESEARQTFGLIVDEHLERLQIKGSAQSTINKNTWLLKDLAKPLSDRPIREINAAEILHLLQEIEASGRRETARRLRGAISTIFKLAIVTLRAEADPTIPLHGALLPPKTVGRAAIVDEKQFGVLLSDIYDYDGWPTITAALKLLTLTCVRPGEVRGATREEFDLGKAIWHIPAERMKMRNPHEVPLSKQALAVLHEIWPLSKGGNLVFPSIRLKTRPLSENAFNSAFRRMGYSKEKVTAHGLRASANTILNSRGHDPDVIEAILAHQDKNEIRRAYNRSTYWPQRIELMQVWADLCDELRRVKIR